MKAATGIASTVKGPDVKKMLGAKLAMHAKGPGVTKMTAKLTMSARNIGLRNMPVKPSCLRGVRYETNPSEAHQ